MTRRFTLYAYENNRQLLEASITLAQAYGVDKNKIIKNADDLDAFMMA